MSFGSNVEPRRKVKSERTDWYCHSCDKEVKRWYTKCPDCKADRNE